MADSTISDLTVDEFKKLIREVVLQTLSEIFGDPDQGLELREEFEVELRRTLAADDPRQTSPAQEVAARLGLTW